MDYNQIFSEIKEISSLNNDKNLLTRVIKAQEELGELSAEVLIDCGFSKKERTPKQLKENIFEESIDLFIMAVDIINLQNRSDAEIIAKIQEKLNKWKTNHLSNV